MGALTPAAHQKLTTASVHPPHSVPPAQPARSVQSMHPAHSTQSVQPVQPSPPTTASVPLPAPPSHRLRRTQSLENDKPKAQILGIPYSSVEEKYILGRQLGKSIAGVVRRCLCRKTGEPFACKTLLKSRMSRPADIADVRAEVSALRKLSGHANVAAIRGVAEDEESVHIITEACDGGDLFHHLKHKRFRERDAASMCKTLLSVTDYCHEMGIMHRNLKPENIWMVTTDTESDIKITDFGQVAFFQKGTKLTDAVGTPYYVAPEVLNRSYGPEADIWSLGVILYILLCGVPPFWAEKREAIFLKIREGIVDTDHGVWQNISKEAKDLVKRMLCVNVSERITAREAQEHPWILQNCPPLIEIDQLFSSEEIPLVNPIEISTSPPTKPQIPSLPLPPQSHNSSSPSLTIRTGTNNTHFPNNSNLNISSKSYILNSNISPHISSNISLSRNSATEESSPSSTSLPPSRPLISSRSISPSNRCFSLSLLETLHKPPTSTHLSTKNPINPPSLSSVNHSLSPPSSHHNSRSQSPSPKSPFSDQKPEILLSRLPEKNLNFSPRGHLPPRSNSSLSPKPATRQYGLPLFSPQSLVDVCENSNDNSNNHTNNNSHSNNRNNNDNNNNHSNSNNNNHGNNNNNNNNNVTYHNSNSNYQIPQNSNSNYQISQNNNLNYQNPPQNSNSSHQISQNSNNNSQNSNNNYQISTLSAGLHSHHFSPVSQTSSGTSSPSPSLFPPSPFSNSMENGGTLSPPKSPLRTVFSCKGDSGSYSIDFHDIQVVVDYDKLEEVIGITVLPINRQKTNFEPTTRYNRHVSWA